MALPEGAERVVGLREDVYEAKGKIPGKALTDESYASAALSEDATPALVLAVGREICHIEEDPRFQALTKYERGRVLAILGDHEKAATLLDDVIGDESLDQVMRGSAMVNRLMGQDLTADERVAKLRQAIELGSPGAYLSLALHYFKQNDYENAKKVMIESILRRDNIVHLGFYMGIILASVGGDHDAAIVEIKPLIELLTLRGLDQADINRLVGVDNLYSFQELLDWPDGTRKSLLELTMEKGPQV